MAEEREVLPIILMKEFRLSCADARGLPASGRKRRRKKRWRWRRRRRRQRREWKGIERKEEDVEEEVDEVEKEHVRGNASRVKVNWKDEPGNEGGGGWWTISRRRWMMVEQ